MNTQAERGTGGQQSRERKWEKMGMGEIDLEYELCGNIIKHTANELFHREGEIMMRSNELLDYLASRFPSVPNVQLDTTFDTNLHNNRSVKSGAKIFSRRNSSNCSGVLMPAAQALKEVKQSCSKKVFASIHGLVQQNKKLTQKLFSIQNKDKTQRKRLQVYEKNQQMALMFQTKNKMLQEQKEALKKKVSELESTLSNFSDSNKQQEQHSCELKLVLEQKERIISEKVNMIKSKEQKLEKIESNMTRVLEEKLLAISCQKCCSLLKRIKESLLGYRNILKQQSVQLLNLYEKHKRLILN